MLKKVSSLTRLIFFNHCQHFLVVMPVKLKCQVHNLIEYFCFNNLHDKILLSNHGFFFYWGSVLSQSFRYKYWNCKQSTKFNFLSNSTLKTKKRRRLENLITNERILSGSLNKKLIFLFKHSNKTHYNFSGKTRINFFKSNKTIILFEKNRKFCKKKNWKRFAWLKILIQNFFIFEKIIKNSIKLPRKKTFKFIMESPFYLKEGKKIGKVLRKCIHLFFCKNKEKFQIIKNQGLRFKAGKSCFSENNDGDFFSFLELKSFSSGPFEKIKMLYYNPIIFKILKKRKTNTIHQCYNKCSNKLVNEYGCPF